VRTSRISSYSINEKKIVFFLGRDLTWKTDLRGDPDSSTGED